MQGSTTIRLPYGIIVQPLCVCVGYVTSYLHVRLLDVAPSPQQQTCRKMQRSTDGIDRRTDTVSLH